MSTKQSTRKVEKDLIDNSTQKAHFSKDLQDKTLLTAAIVKFSDDAIITKTPKGIITYWNDGAEHIYGYSSQEVLGKPISILIPPGHVDEVPEILSDSIDLSRSLTVELSPPVLNSADLTVRTRMACRLDA